MRRTFQGFVGVLLCWSWLCFLASAKGRRDWLVRVSAILAEEDIRLDWLIDVQVCGRDMMPEDCMTQARILNRLSMAVLRMPRKTRRRLLRPLADITLDLLDNTSSNDISDVADAVLETVNDVLDIDVQDILESQDLNETSSEILDALDTLSTKVGEFASDGTPTKIEKSNIGIAARRVENVDSDVYVLSTEQSSKLSVSIANSSSSSSGKHLALMKLPRRMLRANESIVSFAYRNNALFLRSDDESAGTLAKGKTKSRVNSIILSARIGNRTISNLKNPIVLKFEKNNTERNANTSCVFWKRVERNDAKRKGSWSTRGCSLVNESTTNVFCQCDHLTNFAILFDVSQSSVNSLELQIITWIGCGISLAGLIITIVTFTIFKKLRKSLPAKILIFLCVHLSLLIIIFLSGVERTDPRVACQVIASLTHFFLLSSFCWMLVEGGNLYRNVVIVYINTAQKKFLMYSILFAEGVPAIIVIATGIASSNELGNESFCVVNGKAFYFGVLLPIGLILLLNTVCLILVMSRLTCKKDKVTKSIKSETSSRATQARILFTCSMTLGLTWIFAILALDSATTVFQWLFAIFNSLQGFFIFFFRTLRNDDVTMHWKACCGVRNDKPNTVNMSQVPLKAVALTTAENSPAVTPVTAHRSPISTFG